jgi:hypothetical protein
MARQNRQTLIFAIGCDQSRQHHAALPLSILLLWAGRGVEATKGRAAGLFPLRRAHGKAATRPSFPVGGACCCGQCFGDVVHSLDSGPDSTSTDQSRAKRMI